MPLQGARPTPTIPPIGAPSDKRHQLKDTKKQP